VFATGSAHEMIVVTPDAYTRFQGSMYSNSVTTGNWEDFIAKELVSYIDGHYRTIARAESRGLCGHSMGGYGTLRIGEKNPSVFSSIYLLSPCCLNSPNTSSNQIPRNFLRADSINTLPEFEKTDFGTKTVFASAAAWSPNPTLPPFYIDLPVKDGQLQPMVLAKWEANRPLNSLDQYISNIRKLKAIAFDAGTRDQSIAASIKILDEELNKYGIKHFFEIYDGDHINRVAERIEKKMASGTITITSHAIFILGLIRRAQFNMLLLIEQRDKHIKPKQNFSVSLPCIDFVMFTYHAYLLRPYLYFYCRGESKSRSWLKQYGIWMGTGSVFFGICSF
jgi:S-formylglutathione hydrolase FrmB